MKNKKSFLIVSALLAAGAALAVPTIANLATADVVQSEVNFEDKLVGEYFNIPTKKITKDQVSKDASFKVVSPCGATYFDNQLIANEIGEWKVIYYAMFDGFPFEEVYSFNVTQKTYTANKSKFYIGENTEYFKNSGTGINLSLVKNDVFECAQFIDLKELTASKPFIEIGMAPVAKGSREATEVTIRLTDAYDSSNYVDYKLHDPNIKEASYPGLGTVECTFAGQDCMMSMEYIKKDGLKYNEKFIVDNNGYGAYLYMSFTGDYYETTRANSGGPKDPLAKLAFDVKTSHCLVLDKHNSDTVSPRYPDGQTIIADLSRTDYTTDNDYIVTMSAGKHGFTEPFKGFKDNKVKLSIFASGYTGNEINLFISTINNKKVENVTDSTIEDVLNPIIDVDTLGYEENNLPLGKVNVPYRVFNAEAIDDFTANIDLHTNVYYLNGQEKTYSLPIKDGCFTPNKAGKYLLEYKATDGSKNVGLKSFEITVQEKVALPNLVPNFDLLPTTAYCGQTLTLPEATYSASSGNANLEVKVTIGQREMPVTNNKLFLGEKGNYKVTYTVTDYLGQKTTAYTMINVTPDTKPILYDEISFYPLFIAGKKYKLDNALAYDFNVMEENEPTPVVPVINVFMNGQQIETQNNEFTVPDVETGKIKLSYLFAGSKGTLVVAKEISIIKMESNNVKDQDILKYFVSENPDIVGSADDSAVSFTFRDEGIVKFINKVPTYNSSFILNIGKNGTVAQNFAEKINIYFTDSLDSSKVVKVSFVAKSRGAVTSFMQINDGKLYDCQGNFTSNSSFNFVLDTKTNQVICDLITKAPIETYYNGKKFDGFHDNSAFVTFEVESLTEGRAFKLDIFTIAGQRCYANSRGDKIAPVIQVNGEAKHRYAHGETIETFTASAYDVLQPLSTLKMSIVDEDNNPITLVDGTIASNLDPKMNYKFKMDKYGKYFALYESNDGVGNTSNKKIIYVVEDDEKPVINGTFNKAIKVKVNELVKFDKVTFQDNVTDANNIAYVCLVKDPTGIITRIKSGQGSSVSLEYTFTSVGKWTVIWSAEDEIGNISYAELTVYVE